MSEDKDYYVEVCSYCLTASCWHGEFLCMNSVNAGTRTMKASQLRAAGREHHDHFSRAKLEEVCGSVKDVEP